MYTSGASPGKEFPMNYADDYGQKINEAMTRLHLSNRSAAKLSGVSRRHLSTAQKGGNVSINVMRKIMTAFRIREITIASDATIKVSLGEQASMPMLDAAADQVERAVGLARNALAILRTLSPVVGIESGKLDDADQIIRAAALIQEFTDHVRVTVSQGKSLAPLESALSASLSDSDMSDTPALKQTSTRGRKRTKTA
jgi:transcriptional regulator with XRE-family HTH domain